MSAGGAGAGSSGGWIPLALEGARLLASQQQGGASGAPSAGAHTQYLRSLRQIADRGEEEEQPKQQEVGRLLEAMGIPPEMRPLLLYGLLAQRGIGLRETQPDYSDPSAYQTDVPWAPEANRPEEFSAFVPLNPYAGILPPLSVPPPDENRRAEIEQMRSRRPAFPPRRWSEL